MNKKPERFFIVVYCVNDCIQMPMKFDKGCEGALCCGDAADVVAAFADAAAARRAIRISERYARLCKEQGKPVNDDFLGPYRKNVKIATCGIDRVKEDTQ